MDNSKTPPARRGVAVFDLDGTLTWRDTLLPFLIGYIGYVKSDVAERQTTHVTTHLARLMRLPVAMLGYVVDGDRGRLKSGVIKAVMGGGSRVAVEAWATAFVLGMKARGTFRNAALAALEAHRTAGDHLVLLSASPDLYVPRIGRYLGFELTLCTEVSWLNERLVGSLRTPNRHGEEKARCLAWLRTRYPALPITAYGNSAADLPHLRLADRACLVNAGRRARRAAARLGIESRVWV